MAIYGVNLLGESSDLLDEVNYILEFEDENGNTVEDEGDADFSMDDAGDEPAPAAEDTPEEAPEATDADEDEEYSMDEEETENTEDTPEEENQEEEQNEDEDFEMPDEGEEGSESTDAEDEDFSMDDDSSEGEEGETPEGDSMEDTPSDENIDPKLKDLESVIFDDLNEEEKKLKIKELKELFITVYKKCGSISELLSDIKKDEETIQIVEYISNTLIDLKQYVDDYINSVFDSKTYVENLSQLQKYIMIFNAINKVFDQIKRENNE